MNSSIKINSIPQKRRLSVDEGIKKDSSGPLHSKVKRRNSDIPINRRDIVIQPSIVSNKGSLLTQHTGFQSQLLMNQSQIKPQGRRKSLKTEARSRAGSIDVTLLLDDNATLKPISNGKLPHSYATIITYAILHHPTKKMTLNEIYNWILNRYPHFKDAGCGWKNSIRHNLSLNRIFVKMTRPEKKAGKGSYWTVDFYVLRESITNGAKKRRIPPEILFSNGLWPRINQPNRNLSSPGYLNSSNGCKNLPSNGGMDFNTNPNAGGVNQNMSSLAAQIKASQNPGSVLEYSDTSGFNYSLHSNISQNNPSLPSNKPSDQGISYFEHSKNLVSSILSKSQESREFYLRENEIEMANVDQFGFSQQIQSNLFNTEAQNIEKSVSNNANLFNCLDPEIQNSSSIFQEQQLDPDFINAFDFPINFQDKFQNLNDQFTNNQLDLGNKTDFNNEVESQFFDCRFNGFTSNNNNTINFTNPYLSDYEQHQNQQKQTLFQKSIPFPLINENGNQDQQNRAQNQLTHENSDFSDSLLFNYNMMDFINCVDPSVDISGLSLFPNDGNLNEDMGTLNSNFQQQVQLNFSASNSESTVTNTKVKNTPFSEFLFIGDENNQLCSNKKRSGNSSNNNSTPTNTSSSTATISSNAQTGKKPSLSAKRLAHSIFKKDSRDANHTIKKEGSDNDFGSDKGNKSQLYKDSKSQYNSINFLGNSEGPTKNRNNIKDKSTGKKSSPTTSSSHAPESAPGSDIEQFILNGYNQFFETSDIELQQQQQQQQQQNASDLPNHATIALGSSMINF
ncbi:Forkhead box protein J2 [Smittium culicis]|uniref:Forkhead box protein J2 n=1 Tax=Smittium culicis TaxID=133412 RepID=A0A1R1Y8H7_9FUNG|nr:Forkhead box protein J2 [Smittium culicis]